MFLQQASHTPSIGGFGLKQVVEALQELLDALEDATTKLSELPSFQAAIKEEQARRLLDSW